MILELHFIQNFAPSNLNRGDTGAPKDCIFGGSRRARISSQCFKRAMREHFKANFGRPANLAERSTRLVEEIATKLKTKGKEKGEAAHVVETALNGMGLKMSSKDTSKTQYLLFLGREEIENFARKCLDHYDALLGVAPHSTEGLSSKDAKKAKKGVFPPEIAKTLLAVLDGGKAADLALFGRMLADLPQKNRDASSQVAHAISTHRVGLEFDFFTAVDDLKPDDTAGSDHLGTVEFNSACFYRYANVNVDKLRENLGEDEELTRATVESYIKAAVDAIPTGKQNSFATHEKPSFVMAVVRDGGMCSLANAFVKPARETGETDLVSASVGALESHWQKLANGYGDTSKKFVLNVSNHELTDLKDAERANLGTLITNTMAAIRFQKEA